MFQDLPSTTDHIQPLEMASRKRSESKTAKERPPRACIVCTEVDSNEIALIRPCRSCSMDYCINCLVEMFQAAVDDNTRMPPRCCTLIQIHTVLGHGLLSLTPAEAKAYREKFEEWITPSKFYCPFPRCSAFIPGRKLPRNSIDSANKPEIPSLQTILTEILEELNKSHQARFFRDPIDLTQFPKYDKLISTPIDLNAILKRLSTSYYKSTADLTKDIRLIVSNAKKYNGEKHPVARAAEEFFTRYLDETSKATDHLLRSVPPDRVETLFACPKCSGAICISCKQIAHPETPCDTSAQDHEVAMLEQYGYKRCPRCKAGVKKMFGCSHMQCHCGAHWCYYCQKPVEQCDGGCAAAADEIDSEEDYDSDEDGSQMSEDGAIDDEPLRPAQDTTSGPATMIPPPQPPSIRSGSDEVRRARYFMLEGHAAALRAENGTARNTQDANSTTGANRKAPENWSPTTSTNQNVNAPVNLDAGGNRRWAEADYDFGEEPEDEGVAQVWSCKHNFKLYTAPPDDGINRGNLDEMECNRCLFQVIPRKEEVKPPSSKKRKKNTQSQGSKADPILIKEETPSPVVEVKMAWECGRCKLVVCAKCKDMYKLD